METARDCSRAKMKLTSSYILCLSLLLFHAPFSQPKRGGGRGRGGFGSKSHSSKSNTGYKRKGAGTQEKYSHQPVHHNPPQMGGRGYPKQQYPGGRFEGSYGSYPRIQINPENKIRSPHYSGSFGYRGYDTQDRSPFSQQVRGMTPDARSRGFGRKAVMAAAGGAVAGMALGYGLGRFPSPHFQLRNRQEEYYYNHYNHRKSKERPSDTKHHNREQFRPPPQDYSRYMDLCMERSDLFPAEKPKPAVAASVTGQTANKKKTNMSAVEGSSSSFPVTPPLSNPQQASLAPDSSAPINSAEDDADTVSIMEIGYPALIQQVKGRRCLEMYMSLESGGGATALSSRFQGVSAVLLAMILTALKLLH
uniref:Prion protein, related sequence 3 n=1 Tax=Oryzias latipes TaxID=8090 RepID=A0A3P9LT07_ORYLA